VAIINEMRCAMTATHSVDVQRNAAANQPADPVDANNSSPPSLRLMWRERKMPFAPTRLPTTIQEDEWRKQKSFRWQSSRRPCSRR